MIVRYYHNTSMTTRNLNALPEDLSEHTGYLMVRLGKHAEATFTTAIAPLGLRPPHYDMLVTLAADLAGSQKELADLLRIDQAHLVALLDELETGGLVTRATDQSDRRRNVVELTSAGKHTVGRARAIAADVQESILAPLAIAEREAFQAMLRKLADSPNV